MFMVHDSFFIYEIKDTKMKHIDFTPCVVCSRHISFDVDADGKLHNIEFTGGCPGNTHGVAVLCEGADAADTVRRLRGIDCRGRGTSCPDQLAQAVAGAIAD